MQTRKGEIVEFIRKMRSSCMQVELFWRKLDLMLQQEAWKAKEEIYVAIKCSCANTSTDMSRYLPPPKQCKRQ